MDADLLSLFVPDLIQEDILEISWKDIFDPIVLLNEDFKSSIDGSLAREFIKVTRLDIGKDYYIVPFDKYECGRYSSYAAILIDATDGHFIQASYVKEPVIYVPITKEEAIEAIIKDMPDAVKENIDARLVWQPGETSPSPFYPYWEVTVGEKIYYVTER